MHCGIHRWGFLLVVKEESSAKFGGCHVILAWLCG